MSTSLTDSHTETSFQGFGKPSGVGLVSTEGEKLLNALRKIQIKLHQKQQKISQKTDINSLDTNRSAIEDKHCGSGDHHCHHHRRNGVSNQRPSDDNCNQLIESRLQLIESQLHSISTQLAANTCAKHEANGHKRSSAPSVTTTNRKTSPTKDHQMNGCLKDHISGEDKYETTITAIKAMIDSKKISKTKSLETLNVRSHPSKHFHLQYRDIPFLLGTNSSRSHSVIANRQIEISKLKQHNQLCTDQLPTRKIFSQTVRTQVLDAEIKELLFDLHEEHDYICEEIQHLSKQLETITDERRRMDFNRDLYFLSRRILAKKRQINEIQELHSIVIKNAVKSSESIESMAKPKAIKERPYVGTRSLAKQSAPKWI